MTTKKKTTKTTKPTTKKTSPAPAPNPNCGYCQRKKDGTPCKRHAAGAVETASVKSEPEKTKPRPRKAPPNKALDYALAVVENRVPAPKYVKKQCRVFIRIAKNRDPKYIINQKKLRQIDLLLQAMNMPRGLKQGQSLYKTLTGYQWLFITAVLCVVYRDNPNKRRYETALLEIARKNFKTYTIATVFILLMLLEPANSKFYSVAPDGALSREVKDALEETLRASPAIMSYNGKDRFDLFMQYTRFNPNRNRFTPLNYSSSRLDGKFPAAFLADEVGALPNRYAIDAMESGQLNMLNKLGCIISTKYNTIDNPLEDEVRYAKRVLDGIEPDEQYFALLYEPDKTKAWMTDDMILRHANPVATEIPEIWNDLLKRRTKAIAMPTARENFLTKHCNIIWQGTSAESFVDVPTLQEGRLEAIDWEGRNVYVGVDLSMTNDNVGVGFVAEEDGHILAEAVAFIPEGRIEEKNKSEKLNYRRFIEEMKAIACGNKTIDYAAVEQFVFDIEATYGVKVMSIGYDRYNALSSAQKWANEYDTVEVKQISSVLHPATKLLQEKIANGEFHYTKNTLLEINFQNAKVAYDTNMNRYIHKKKSNGKIDMVAAIVNAVVLLNLDVFLNEGGDFVVQTG